MRIQNQQAFKERRMRRPVVLRSPALEFTPLKNCRPSGAPLMLSRDTNQCFCPHQPRRERRAPGAGSAAQGHAPPLPSASALTRSASVSKRSSCTPPSQPPGSRRGVALCWLCAPATRFYSPRLPGDHPPGSPVRSSPPASPARPSQRGSPILIPMIAKHLMKDDGLKYFQH